MRVPPESSGRLIVHDDLTRNPSTHDRPPAPTACPRSILWPVLVVALIANTLSLAASQLWLFPDSRWYLQLAAQIADRGDFSNDLFLIRTPGYPLLLAGIFRLFGSSSPAALLVLQHAMIVGVALLTTATAWHACRRRGVALVTGLLCAANLPLLSYANIVMTEACFAILLAGSVFLLLRYWRFGGRWSLAIASLLAGASYHMRPTGVLVVGVCLTAAMLRTHRQAQRLAADHPDMSTTVRHGRSGWRLRAGHAGLALAPALLMVLPWTIHTSMCPRHAEAGSVAAVVMYQRALWVEGLDAPDSRALAEIKSVVAEARRLGHLPPNRNHHQWFRVWRAYNSVHGASLAQTCPILSQAGHDLFLANYPVLTSRTITHMGRTLLTPDEAYRFQPGGVMGDGYTAAKDAEILNIATYLPMMQQDIDALRHHLPLRTKPRALTPFWAGVARWHHRHIDIAPPWLGLGDSLYEDLIWLCIIGGVLVLFTRDRVAWLLVAAVIATQVGTHAFLAGTQPRYAVPSLPLVHMFGAWLVVTTASRLVAATRRLLPATGSSDNRTSEWHPVPTERQTHPTP